MPKTSIGDRIGKLEAAALAERWWVFFLRGVLAVLFAVVGVVSPKLTLFALVLYVGAFVLVDGVVTLGAAAHAGRSGKRWGWLVFEGLVAIAAGVLTFAWPSITALMLLFLIAGRAIFGGAAELFAAIRLRREIEGEWALGLSGALSMLFGLILLFAPRAGALALVVWIATYAFVLGLLMIALALRLRSWQRGGDTHLPTGGTPRHA